jgi:lichenan operon transcriptional antiterminator
MIKEDVASEYFADLVMERENKFSTIYNKGIAAPHPLRLEAKTSTIGVTILRNPIEWQGKEVSLIFLINLKQGHLFLHKEISNFLMKLMDNDAARKALLQVHSFDEFLSGFESLL